MGFNGMITKGYIRIEPRDQAAAHAAILALHEAPSISHHPVGFPEEFEELRRRTVVLPQRCLESEDVWEAIASFSSFYMPEVPAYVPQDLQFDVNAKGEAYNFRDEWRRVGREEELWHALAPYLRRLTVRYEGDNNTKWCYQKEADGLVWEWAARPWRKVEPLVMRELERPKKLVFGWTKVTNHVGGKVEQYEVNLETGERRAWSDPAAAKLPVVTLGPNHKR